MSIEALNAVINNDVSGGAGRFAVAVVLANYADENGECYPSVARLATITQQSERAVRGHIEALELAGVIERRRIRYANGSLGGYRYKVLTQYLVAPPADSASGRKRQSPPAESAAHIQKTLTSTKLDSKGALQFKFENMDSTFSAAWSAYPAAGQVNTAQADARRAFEDLAPTIAPDRIAAAVRAYGAAIKRAGSAPLGMVKFLRSRALVAQYAPAVAKPAQAASLGNTPADRFLQSCRDDGAPEHLVARWAARTIDVDQGAGIVAVTPTGSSLFEYTAAGFAEAFAVTLARLGLRVIERNTPARRPATESSA